MFVVIHVAWWGKCKVGFTNHKYCRQDMSSQAKQEWRWGEFVAGMDSALVRFSVIFKASFVGITWDVKATLS